MRQPRYWLRTETTGGSRVRPEVETMRIGVATNPVMAREPVHTVAVALSDDVDTDHDLRDAEVRAVRNIFDDPAFRAAAQNGLSVIGESIVDYLAPGASDVVGGNAYVAVVTDLMSTASLLNKGDKLNLFEKASNVTAEVVDVIADTIPGAPGVKFVTTVLKIAVPLGVAAIRFKKNARSAALEAAAVQALGARATPHAPTLYAPTPEVSEKVRQYMADAFARAARSASDKTL